MRGMTAVENASLDVVRAAPASAAASGQTSVPASPRPDTLILMLPLVIATYVWRVQDLFPILGKVKLPLFVGLATLAIFFSVVRGPRRLQAIDSPLSRMLLGLFAIMFLGIPTSLAQGASLSFLLKDFMPNLLLAMMVAAGVRNMRDLEWVMRGTVVGGALYCLYIYMRFHVGADGRLAELIYYDSNDISVLIVCTLPLAVYFIRPGMKLMDRIVAAAAFVVFLLTLIKGGSRGGFLGLLVVGTVLLVWYRGIPRRQMILVAVAGAALLALRGSDTYWANMKTLLHPTNDYNWTGKGATSGGRRAIWTRGIGYMLHHPLVGLGVRTFSRAEGTLSPGGQLNLIGGPGYKWSAAHNSFVEIGAETGVIGLVLFTGLFVYSIRAMMRLHRRRGPPGSVIGPRESAMAQSIAVAIIGFCVSGSFVSANYFAYPYLLIAMAAGLLKLTRLNPTGAARGAVTPVPLRGPVGARRIAGMRGGAAVTTSAHRSNR